LVRNPARPGPNSAIDPALGKMMGTAFLLLGPTAVSFALAVFSAWLIHRSHANGPGGTFTLTDRVVLLCVGIEKIPALMRKPADKGVPCH
jgi:hypothetical protein